MRHKQALKKLYMTYWLSCVIGVQSVTRHQTPKNVSEILEFFYVTFSQNFRGS